MRPIEEALSWRVRTPILPRVHWLFPRANFLRMVSSGAILPFDQKSRKCYKTNTLFSGSSYAQRARNVLPGRSGRQRSGDMSQSCVNEVNSRVLAVDVPFAQGSVPF